MFTPWNKLPITQHTTATNVLSKRSQTGKGGSVWPGCQTVRPGTEPGRLQSGWWLPFGSSACVVVPASGVGAGFGGWKYLFIWALGTWK